MEKFELIAHPLPYTMGNGGDLIKHGLLAEFTDWHCREIPHSLTYYDPFGGRPWQEPVHDAVSKRIKTLEACPLKEVQSIHSEKYLGSGHIVSQISKQYENKITVFSSDSDSAARQDLEASGLNLIRLRGFNLEDGLSILQGSIDRSKHALILIDPFYDLENINKKILDKIIRKVKEDNTSIALFVLYYNAEINLWSQFKKINENLTGDSFNYISLQCDAIENSTIEGESKFHSSIILYTHNNYPNDKLNILSENVSKFSRNLTKAVGCPIGFDSQIIS
ncbi:hypothetical protein SCALIN_C10_0029 [Candidatus Scalindua japonica]|uniref:Uncharacterized protein n=1 Tax=Candidatus Scalindua japonica TaxID=1284222 RepID=A0A286TWK0_9BACT|nr:hypothetical protein [Candidatus Scalindua japonica]GAX60269.1 hypothetical protein SCALIN_C10_0029 [Candidatus Scalindua japonica]